MSSSSGPWSKAGVGISFPPGEGQEGLDAFPLVCSEKKKKAGRHLRRNEIEDEEEEEEEGGLERLKSLTSYTEKIKIYLIVSSNHSSAEHAHKKEQM